MEYLIYTWYHIDSAEKKNLALNGYIKDGTK